MNLEDHVGDIVGKARLHAGISLEAAARTAGLAPSELEHFEEAGTSATPPDLVALAGLLDLSPTKLQAVAAGWSPNPVDLETWREMRVITTQGGAFSVNCFLLWDEVTREAALFDTGFDADPVLALIAGESLDLRHIFITHAHADHFAGLAEVRVAHPKAKLHSSAADVAVHERNRPNDFIHLGSLRITNRPTPGHASDGTTYIVGNWPEDAPSVAIVGDAIFAGSMGRAAGTAAEARQAIREQILSLPEATLVCPGHGPLTTVAQEKAHNPFF